MYSNARYILAATFTALIVGCGGGGSQSALGNDSLVPAPPSASNSPYPRPGSTASAVPSGSSTPASGGTASPVTQPVSGGAMLRIDPLITSHISHEITGADFDEIYDALAVLPEDMRDDVVEFTNHGVYGTARDIIESAKSFDKSNLDMLPDTGLSAESTLKAIGPSDVGDKCNPAGFDGCTGQAYVVSTKGYTYESAQVYIPCSASRLDGRHVIVPNDKKELVSKPKQTGFIYLGGESTNGVALDIGLQINARDGQLDSPVSVQMFTTVSDLKGSFTEINGNEQRIENGRPSNPHARCDETVEMTYFIGQASQDDAVARLVLRIRDSLGSHVLITEVNANEGWHQVCPSCSVKRVTAMAVKTNLREQEPLGTWLGVNDAHGRKPTPVISWRNARLGTFSRAGLKSPSSIMPWRSADIKTDPKAGVTRGVFLVNHLDFSNETIGINLAAPKLQINNPKK